MKCQRRTDVSYGNPIIARIEKAKSDSKHSWAIRNMQTSIDNAPPKPMPHLTTFGRDYFAKKKATTEAAFADLKMIQSIAKTMTRPFELPSHRGPTSLNADWRKKELFRITMDNHKLLERLENLKPYYDTDKMERDHAEHHRYMINSSYSARKVGLYDEMLPKQRFPRPLLKPLARGGRSLPALGTLEEHEGGQLVPIEQAPPPAPPKPKKKKKQRAEEQYMEELEDAQRPAPSAQQQAAFVTEPPPRAEEPTASSSSSSSGGGYRDAGPPPKALPDPAPPAPAVAAAPQSYDEDAFEDEDLSPAASSPLKLQDGGVEEEEPVDSMPPSPAKESAAAEAAEEASAPEPSTSDAVRASVLAEVRGASEDPSADTSAAAGLEESAYDEDFEKIEQQSSSVPTVQELGAATDVPAEEEEIEQSSGLAANSEPKSPAGAPAEEEVVEEEVPEGP